MKTRMVFGVLIMMLVMVQAGIAGNKDGIQKYFNDTACRVKAVDDPAQKREILNQSLQTMSKALDKVETSGLVSQDDRNGIHRFKAAVQEKQSELQGMNGFERVSDAHPNAFPDYMVQDMQQAETITISLVAALLIVIILILIL